MIVTLKNILWGFLFLGMLTDIVEAQSEIWPDVAPLEASIFFSNASKAAAWFKILDPKGKPLYLLQCYNWRSSQDPNFDYSGDFECRLTSTYSQEKYSTLLTDDPHQSRDWQSRGRILAEELIGNCSKYPEYGHIRHFRLRKMKITFLFEDVGVKPFQSPEGRNVKRREFDFFRFTLTVEADPAALSEIAEPVPFRPPPRIDPSDPNDFSLKCDKVIK